MAYTIQLDNTDLNDGLKYKVERIDHEQLPDINNDMLDITSRDGAKFISQAYAPKIITIEGTIKGSTTVLLEEAIDDLKKAIATTNGILYIGYAGFVREYNVVISSYSITRKYYNTTFAPFTIQFITSDYPFATEANLGGTDIQTTAFTASDITDDIYSAIFSFGGTAPPVPTTRLVFDDVTSVTKLGFQNRTTGDLLELNNTFTAGDVVIINNDNKSVILNGTEQDYEGTFPDFQLGNNEISINNTGTLVVLDQVQDTMTGYIDFIYENQLVAQSFIPSSTNNIPYIELLMAELHNNVSNPNPHGDLIVEIRTDNAGSPSDTILQSYTQIKSPVGIYSPRRYKIPFVSLTLTSGVTYWIVMKSPNSNYNNGWQLSVNANYITDPYANGELKVSVNGGLTWITDPHINYIDADFRTYYETSVASPATYDIKINYKKKYL